MILTDDTISDDTPVNIRRFIPPKGQTKWKPVALWTDADWSCWLKQHDGWTAAKIKRYLERDRYDYGFGLLKTGALADHTNCQEATWLYKPVPQSVKMHAARTNLMFGGEAGGSKSTSVRWELWRNAFDPEFANRKSDGLPAPYRALLVRRELEMLRRSHLDKFEQESRLICELLDNKNAVKVATYQSPCVTVYHTDARIICGHCHAPGDEEKYLSEDYDDAVSEEGTRLLPAQNTGIQSRVRSDTKIGRPGRWFVPTNPGGPSHDLLSRYFLTHDVSKQENPLYASADFVFVKSSRFDNPFYMDSDGTYTTYEKRLSMLFPARRSQMMGGDWSVVVGQFFSDYNGQRHVRKEPIPRRCAMEVWLRAGVGKAPYACWVACLPDGRLHVFAELLMPNEAIGTCASLIVRHSHEIMAQLETRWSRSIGNAELFPKQAGGESPAETCNREGLYLMKGDATEVHGWERLKHWWPDHPLADQPWLTIDPDCTLLTRTLPTLVEDAENPALLDSAGDTQGAHALRIGVMARPSPSPLLLPKAPLPPDAIGHLVRSVMASPRRKMGTVR